MIPSEPLLTLKDAITEAEYVFLTFGNRLPVIDGFLILGLCLWAYRHFPRSDLRDLAPRNRRE